MVERLTALDASFLYLEEPDTPMHVGGVLVLEMPPGGVESLAALVRARLPLVPRYRQRVLEVPGRLANPVWADDPGFDVTYHVRRHGLPRPGTDAQLMDLVSRLTSRPLDRSRPLWELYLVEGLIGNRVAVVTKTHPALVDGLSAIDIGQVLLDADPEAGGPDPEVWTPRRPPGAVQLVSQALAENWLRRSAAMGTAAILFGDVWSGATRLSGIARGLVRTTWSAVFPAPHTPFNTTTGPQRRVAVARVRLDDVKVVRTEHGGTVSDVLLTVVTGALREWLLSRGQPVIGSTSVRALVPVALQDDEASTGERVSSLLLDLPVGEPNPGVRLARIGYAMRGVAQRGRSIGADSLVALTGFAPPTMHALGVRAARGLSRRLFNLVVTNVPGPQVPMYAAGSRMLEVFQVVPLARGQGVSIGITSYDGCVFFGLNADRDSVGDVDVLADLIEQEVEELVRAAG
jgi:WS/DGAT/MGAT family acyltransferase